MRQAEPLVYFPIAELKRNGVISLLLRLGSWLCLFRGLSPDLKIRLPAPGTHKAWPWAGLLGGSWRDGRMGEGAPGKG